MKMTATLTDSIVNEVCTHDWRKHPDLPTWPDAQNIYNAIEELEPYKMTTNRKNLAHTKRIRISALRSIYKTLDLPETVELPQPVPTILRTPRKSATTFELNGFTIELRYGYGNSLAAYVTTTEAVTNLCNDLRTKHLHEIRKLQGELVINCGTLHRAIKTFPCLEALSTVRDALANEKAEREERKRKRNKPAAVQRIQLANPTGIAKAKLLAST